MLSLIEEGPRNGVLYMMENHQISKASAVMKPLPLTGTIIGLKEMTLGRSGPDVAAPFALTIN